MIASSLHMLTFLAMQVPLEYDLLKEMAPTLLRNRLVLLHHFSDTFCPGIAAFPLGLQVTRTCQNLSKIDLAAPS